MVRSPSSDPTPPQRRILDHLLKRESEGGPPPTYREIAADLGWRAAGTVEESDRGTATIVSLPFYSGEFARAPGITPEISRAPLRTLWKRA